MNWDHDQLCEYIKIEYIIDGVVVEQSLPGFKKKNLGFLTSFFARFTHIIKLSKKKLDL